MPIDARFKSTYITQLDAFFGGPNSALGAQKGPVVAVLTTVNGLEFEQALAQFVAGIDAQKSAQKLNANVAYHAKTLFYDTAATLNMISNADKISRKAKLKM